MVHTYYTNVNLGPARDKLGSLTIAGPTRYSVTPSQQPQDVVEPMDTRVLLANTSKRYDAIFSGLGILDQKLNQLGENTLGADEVLHGKLVELDNKLDLIMAHLGIELPKTEPETPGDGPVSDGSSESTSTE